MSHPRSNRVAPRLRPRWVASALIAVLAASGLRAQVPAQSDPPLLSGVPLINIGADITEARFARLDFAQKYLEEQARQARQKEEQQKQNQKLLASGVVSALDLAAPGKAVGEYNKAASLLQQQKAKEAIPHLEKAIAQYPKFISAHNNLGLAYVDVGDVARGRGEFELAATLDNKFPGSFLNLGRLALSEKDYAAAQSALTKAASLQPRDASTLTALAYAQNGMQQYREAIATAERVHTLDHKGNAAVHYVAAAAALALGDYRIVQRELTLFLQEDPANPLAPVARNNLDVLARKARAPAAQTRDGSAPQRVETFPNSARLRTQLAGLGDETQTDNCESCNNTDRVASASVPADVARSRGGWTIRRDVQEVDVFFSATSHGRTVMGLQDSDVKVLDDGKAPEKVLQFAPQSSMPLRLGLLVDTSGSVQPRFAFEKRAATKFLQSIFSNASDLAFVAGFADGPIVTQDFTASTGDLEHGINQLKNSGGTALFDAVSYASWKLAAYPEQQRVARVLVVLSDGEDNSSHTSLKQTIADAEGTGVTIYVISTKNGTGDKTDADKVLAALAERSGGEALFPGDMMSLERSFEKLRDIIRSRYLVAYRPADFQSDGRYRTITIVAEQDGKRLQVHARKGYHARREKP